MDIPCDCGSAIALGAQLAGFMPLARNGQLGMDLAYREPNFNRPIRR